MTLPGGWTLSKPGALQNGSKKVPLVERWVRSPGRRRRSLGQNWEGWSCRVQTPAGRGKSLCHNPFWGQVLGEGSPAPQHRGLLRGGPHGHSCGPTASPSRKPEEREGRATWGHPLSSGLGWDGEGSVGTEWAGNPSPGEDAHCAGPTRQPRVQRPSEGQSKKRKKEAAQRVLSPATASRHPAPSQPCVPRGPASPSP